MNNYRESAEDRWAGNDTKSRCPKSVSEGATQASSDHRAPVRAIVQIEGNVQGVGFRPYLYRLATEYGLRGSVANSASGVDLEIEGPQGTVEAFLADIARRRPPLATITDRRHQFAEPVGHPAFVIAGSTREGHRTALISPDVAVCDDCLHELFDPSDRRYRYPFINCTNCGPRYTIVAGVPYDRPTTSMACFTMCTACQAEYNDPTSRRFHAQPNACPKCGPYVWLVKDVQLAGRGTQHVTARNPSETATTAVRRYADCNQKSGGDDAIVAAVRLLQQGAIVAVKGIGGFQLACDATNAQAVEALRRRKQREAKPLAVMVPDLEAARHLCHLEAGAKPILTSRERPITLLRKRDDTTIAEAVAQGNNSLGLMLPYAPLHHLLLFDQCQQPRFLALVMTSGNLAEEPIAIGNREALERLGRVADAFLLHNRDILVRADDSVVRYDPHRNSPVGQSALSLVREIAPPTTGEGDLPRNRGGRDFVDNFEPSCSTGPARTTSHSERGGFSEAATMIRRSRGYVPAPVFLDHDVGEVLAVGGHLKNTVAISRGKTVFLSQHIGDLENHQTFGFLKESVAHLQGILGIRPTVVAHDMHPDYLSTRFAQQLEDVQLVAVQHHHAHVAACMAEYGLAGPVIGVVLDGAGYGTDGHVWGGEILIADDRRFQRVAHFREVRMPGNERAIKQPWRMALSYLDATFGDHLWNLSIPFVQQLDRPTSELLLHAARRDVNSPLTSSCGRLFDAVAALVGLRRIVTYEGQAAMELEMAITSECPSQTPLDSTYNIVHLTEKNSSVSPNLSSTRDNFDYPTFVLDQMPLITAVVGDVLAKIPPAVISRRFHQGLANTLSAAVGRVADQTGVCQVVLAGGCFQNCFLQNELTHSLEELNLSVLGHRQVPPNDGGLALGQIVVASGLVGSNELH